MALATYIAIEECIVLEYPFDDGAGQLPKIQIGRLFVGCEFSAYEADMLPGYFIISTVASGNNKYQPSTFSKEKFTGLVLTRFSTGGKEMFTTPDKAVKALSEKGVDLATVNLEAYNDKSKEVSYSSDQTSSDYIDNLSNGLRITDLRGVFGAPFQYLPSTDPRIDGTNSNTSFGRVYTEKILANIPLLLITPGSPIFMTGYKKSQKADLLSKFFLDVNVADNILDSLFSSQSGKYYSLKFDYVTYFNYVNAMLRSAAIFLDIGDEVVDGWKLSNFNWLYRSAGVQGSGIFSTGNLSKLLGTYAGAIPLYIDTDVSYSDSFSNSTTQSSIASGVNALSEKGRELNFVLGAVDGATGLNLDKWTSQNNLSDNIQNVSDQINDLLGGDNILSTITGGAQTIMAGGRMIFPDIYESSSFSKNYGIKMKLIAPAGDKLTVYLTELVPTYHVLGLVLPRASTGQAYFSPMLVRAYYKGMFNVDMGIITDLDISKGAEGEWTVDGLPTVMELSFTIKDLYDGLAMSTATKLGDTNIMTNITELDYIANSCGININDPEITRTVKMFLALNVYNKAIDKVAMGIFGNLSQWASQKLNNIFGVFK